MKIVRQVFAGVEKMWALWKRFIIHMVCRVQCATTQNVNGWQMRAWHSPRNWYFVLMEYILHLKFIALHTAITTHNEVFLYASTLLACNSNNWYFHHDRIHGTNANGLLHLQMLILIGRKHEYNSSIDWSIVALKISLEVKRFNGEIFDVKISFDLTPVPKTWANFRFFPSRRSFLSRFKRWLSPIERYTMIGFEWHSFELCRRYTKCHSNRNLFRLIQIKMIECHTHKCVCI